MATTHQRLDSIETRLARLDERTESIYLAVVGDGSKGSSLRERVATLEVQNDFRHKAVFAAVPAVVVWLLNHLGLSMPGIGGSS